MLYKLELSAIHLDLWRITLCSHARRHRSKMFVPIEILSHECRETCPLGLNNTTPFQEGYDFIRRGTKLKYFPDAWYTPTSIHCHCPKIARTRSTFVLCSSTRTSSTLLVIYSSFILRVCNKHVNDWRDRHDWLDSMSHMEIFEFFLQGFLYVTEIA